MKRFLILVWSVIALSCGAVKDNTLNVDDRQKPLVAYAKLKPKMIKAAYDLETDRHVLGRITRYKYSNSGQLLKESIFNNEKGTLHFYHETGYTYSSNDSLLRKYDYLESAMSITPQLTEYTYTYPSDSLKIMTQVIDSNQIDSTFITTSRDKYGNKIRCSKITDRMFVVPIRKNSNRYNQQTIETKYYYNTNNELINKIEIDKKRKDSSQTHYQYDTNSQLSKVILKNGNYKYIATYKNGLLDTEETGREEPLSKHVYYYNKQGQELKSKLYRDDKHVYSYLTSYTKKGLPYTYEMRDEMEGDSGVWLYKYNKKGQLSYKINLYARTTDN